MKHSRNETFESVFQMNHTETFFNDKDGLPSSMIMDYSSVDIGEIFFYQLHVNPELQSNNRTSRSDSTFCL